MASVRLTAPRFSGEAEGPWVALLLLAVNLAPDGLPAEPQQSARRRRTSGAGLKAVAHPTNRTVDPLVVETCVCPVCGGSLRWRAQDTECTQCGQSYPIVDGIPVFVILRDDDHKFAQADRSFDPAEEAWEIERPHGAPALYGWLMCEKLRRSIEGIEDRVRGEVALVVCAGSGMDAEFLARRGARVIAADLSLPAVQRARERAERQNIRLTPIVADVEALPFSDRGVGLTYVHDGLHHLRDPYVGLREMARVAARAVSINEPVRALVTKIAIWAGIASEHEEPGTKVERLDPDLVQFHLRQAGLTVVGADRYAMFYRHAPGPAMHHLSRSRLLPVTRGAIDSFNHLLGGVSNKLAVRAVRTTARDL